MCPVSLPELNFGSSSQKTSKSRYQTFLVLSSFTGFLYFVPNILPRIVGAVCSTEEASGSNFQFYNPKLSKERCFMTCVCSTGLCKVCSTKKAIEQFELTLENTRYFEFQFHLAKLSQ